MWVASLLFFSVRMSEYGKNLAYDMSSKWVDLAMLILIPFMIVPYLYQLAWGCLEIVQWMPIDEKTLDITFYNASTFFSEVDPDEDEYESHMISFVMQYFFGPFKLTVIADAIMMIVSIISAQWGLVSFFGMPWIISVAMNYVVYPIFPELAMPIVDLQNM